jgi:hypothetical protein
LGVDTVKKKKRRYLISFENNLDGGERMRKTRYKLYLLYQVQEITPVHFGHLLEKEVYLYRLYSRFDIPFEYRIEMIESILDEYRMGLKLFKNETVKSKEQMDDLFFSILKCNIEKRGLKNDGKSKNIKKRKANGRKR